LCAMNYLASLALLTAVSTAVKKQGFSGYLGNYWSCEDSKALNLDDSWYYTWLHEPTARGRSYCNGGFPPGEFVPMVNGKGQAAKLNTPSTHKTFANSEFLLGYNEPDPGNGRNHPHMMDPAEAAVDWVDMQDLAAANNLTLVSPALSTTGLDKDGVSSWMDEFFGNCSEVVAACDPSLIKHVAFHDYTGDADIIMRRADGMQHRYNRTVWITEFAINTWAAGFRPTREQQDKYMFEVLRMLDENPAVERYAWYTARDQPGGAAFAPGEGGNLLVWNSTQPVLTSTGRVYANNAQNTK